MPDRVVSIDQRKTCCGVYDVVPQMPISREVNFGQHTNSSDPSFISSFAPDNPEALGLGTSIISSNHKKADDSVISCSRHSSHLLQCVLQQDDNLSGLEHRSAAGGVMCRQEDGCKLSQHAKCITLDILVDHLLNSHWGVLCHASLGIPNQARQVNES